jgi:hypothetical protein
MFFLVELVFSMKIRRSATGGVMEKQQQAGPRLRSIGLKAQRPPVTRFRLLEPSLLNYRCWGLGTRPLRRSTVCPR